LQEAIKELQELKEMHQAVIVAHNYQLEEVQQVADYVGDSFYLSKVAAKIQGKVIVFCGVRFMAETAKILAPDKEVLLPEIDAGCPLADMITADDLRKLKAENPGAPVICYINSSIEVKAESDVCCTSANALKVAAALPGKKLIFVPDGNLGDYVAKQLPDKEFVLWPGHCYTHAKIKPEDVLAARENHFDAKILIHPECDPAVVGLADFAGSTSQIMRYAETSDAAEFIIGTEMGVLYQMKAKQPEKKFYLLHSGLICPNMKKTRLSSVVAALKDNKYQITVDQAIAKQARRTLERMLELA